MSIADPHPIDSMFDNLKEGTQLMSIYSYEHYVYLYLRESDGTPYYVGKGKGARYKERHLVNIPPKEENIVFVAKNLSNFEACILEKRLIRFYGRKDLGEGILYNRTNGGDGGDTSKSENYQYWLENIARNKDSDYNKAITQRMKENNPLFDPKIAAKCQTPEARKKRGLSRWGEIRSKEQRQKISNTLKKQSKEMSKRTSKLWETEDYRKNTSEGMKRSVVEKKQMTEEEFYEWMKDKNPFSYDSKRKIYRPNARVKLIIDHFGKTEEFYGNYYREKERNLKKS